MESRLCLYRISGRTGHQNGAGLGYTATTIVEPTELARTAERNQASPIRLEKDIRVNAALQGLGQAHPWEQGGFLFMGGTSLTKAWRLSPRFSEDIDLRFQLGHAEADLRTYAANSVTEPAFHELYDRIRHHVLPRIPDSWIDEERSYHRQDWAVQLVFIQFPSHFQTEPGTLKFALLFLPGRVPWTYRPVFSHPHLMQSQEAQTLARLPTASVWVTMKGKLEAIASRNADWQLQHMRHLVDLGVWLEQDLAPQIHAHMAQACLAEKSIKILVEGLTDNLSLLGSHSRYADMFRNYIRTMYPGGPEVPRPLWEPTLRRIQSLWLDICRADIDPYPMVIPDWPLPVPPESREITSQEIRAIESRFQELDQGSDWD